MLRSETLASAANVGRFNPTDRLQAKSVGPLLPADCQVAGLLFAKIAMF